MAANVHELLEAVVVQEVRRCVVLPALPSTQYDIIVLPSLDTCWRHTHYNQRLIFYEGAALAGSSPTLSTQVHVEQVVMEKLKSSLALCLVHYYPWCGRLALIGDDRPDQHSLVIDFNDTGVDFVEARVDIPMSELAKNGYQMMPFFERLCQDIEHNGDCLYTSPLLSVQATIFLDGGLALGIAQSHVVADGQSLWNFMVSWGECSRGINPLSLPPSHDRQRLAVPRDVSSDRPVWSWSEGDEENEDQMKEPGLMGQIEDVGKANMIDPASIDSLEAAQTDGHVEAIGTSSKTNLSSSAPEPIPGEATQPADPLVQCLVHLSSSAIKKLKSNAGGEGFTSYEVTCAHFWKHVTAARQSSWQEPTYLFTLANGRSRLEPPLPPSYFGNAVMLGVSCSSSGIVHAESLHDTANRIHATIAKIQRDYIERFMYSLENHMSEVTRSFALTFKAKTLNIASSPRFPVYEVDFGWGKPSAVRSAKVLGDGELVLFGGRPGSNQGDMEICMALPRSVLTHLLADPQFLATTTQSAFHQC